MDKRTCAVSDCEIKARCKGFCALHYRRWKTHGDPLFVTPRVKTESCSIDGCGRPHIARGWCDIHYRRWKRGESFDQMRRPTEIAREAFGLNTVRRGDCVLWTGFTDRGGYGILRVPGGTEFAHRFSWERENGPIPDGMRVDHICHNPTCVNPEHLRLATHTENAWNRAGAQAGSTTGARNVHRNGSNFAVRITCNKERLYFGTYPTIEEAAEVAERERARLFGDFSGRG